MPVVIIVDQGIKLLILRLLSNPQDFYDWFSIRIRLVKNSGMALGIPLPNMVMTVIMAILILLLGLVYKQLAGKFTLAGAIGYALLLGGAGGNFIDRIIHGAVIDYLDFRRFPVFNAADVFIMVGVGLIALWYVRQNNGIIHSGDQK